MNSLDSLREMIFKEEEFARTKAEEILHWASMKARYLMCLSDNEKSHLKKEINQIHQKTVSLLEAAVSMLKQVTL